MKKISMLFMLLVVLGLSGHAFSQDLKTLQPEDYDQWQSLRSSTISDDGQWVAYQLAPNEGNDTLYIENTATEAAYNEAFGTRLQFSQDSRYALYLIGVSKEKKEKLEKSKKSVHYKLAVLDLDSGKKIVYPEVSSFNTPDEGPFVLLTTYKPKGSSGKGKDQVLLNLNDQTMRTLGNISDIGFNKSARYLAYIKEPANALGYGVEVLDLEKNTIQVLASDTLPFNGLTWHKEGKSLAFYHTIKDDAYEDDNYEVISFRNIAKGWNKAVLNPIEFAGFAADMKIKNSRIQWAEDESALFFGIQPWEMKPDKKEDKEKSDKDSEGEEEAKEDDDEEKPTSKSASKKKDEKLPGVDVWHWKDSEVQPRQKKSYNRDKEFAFLSMWDLDAEKFMQIADSTFRNVRLTGDQKHALVYTEKPYEPQFRLSYADYEIVNLKSGERKPLLKKYTGYINSSPDGKYVLYFKDKNWYTYSILEDQHTNLTAGLDVPFWNIRDDHPAEVRPPFGSGGWMKDDKAVLLYDEYDVWSFKPGGSGSELLTNGREQEIIFRVRKMDNENDYLDPKETLFLSVFGDKTKKSGFYTMRWGKEPQELIFVDKSISAYGFRKAEDADTYMWTESTYVDPPRLMVADEGLVNKKEIVQINKQQEEFAWGKAELVNFTNKNGKDLQGVLHYPAGYEEGKQYPMLVYIYEIRSNSLHRYINPSTKSFYNITNYVQQGFFVFQPDIVYRLDDPGMSAVECVIPAVEKVLETGMVDRDRLGLMGHSWGAYQTAFIITQTDLFSAAVAGAPLTDMISMYTEIYWNSGTPNQQIFETSQGRFTKPYWEIMDKYIQNSPMFQARNISTPLLVAFGDKDGAVDWHQGIELYTTMRRMEKPYVMLVYEGENHSVRKEENMLDYTKKINQWFNHYLLQKDPADWIIEGIPYLEKKKKEDAKKK